MSRSRIPLAVIKSNPDAAAAALEVHPPAQIVFTSGRRPQWCHSEFYLINASPLTRFAYKVIY